MAFPALACAQAAPAAAGLLAVNETGSAVVCLSVSNDRTSQRRITAGAAALAASAAALAVLIPVALRWGTTPPLIGILTYTAIVAWVLYGGRGLSQIRDASDCEKVKDAITRSGDQVVELTRFAAWPRGQHIGQTVLGPLAAYARAQWSDVWVLASTRHAGVTVACRAFGMTAHALYPHVLARRIP